MTKQRFYQVQNFDGNGKEVSNHILPAQSKKAAEDAYQQRNCKVVVTHLKHHEVYKVQIDGQLQYNVPSLDETYDMDRALSSNTNWESIILQKALDELHSKCANSETEIINSYET